MATAANPKSTDNVRAVERAIELLQALNRSPISTLGDLHRQTGIPKSSIVRLLRALETQGLVTQTASYSAYRLREHVTSLSSGFAHQPRIVEAAETRMIAFTRREGWPLALALFDRGAMVVRASTIPYTTLAPIQSSLEIRLSLVGYALGQAYLAHLPSAEQKVLLQTARTSPSLADRSAQDVRGTQQMLKQVRERGYALRNQLFHSESSTVAVPVFDRGRVAASLGLTWLAAAVPPHHVVETYVPQLTAMAEGISRDLEA